MRRHSDTEEHYKFGSVQVWLEQTVHLQHEARKVGKVRIPRGLIDHAKELGFSWNEHREFLMGFKQMTDFSE